MTRIPIRLAILTVAVGLATSAPSCTSAGEAPGAAAPPAAPAVVPATPADLAGTWALRVMNPENREVATLTVRFTGEAAASCLMGDWRRVAVEASRTTDEAFFPASEPLSYQVDGSEITIGRNEVCDAYLHLRGALDGGKVAGTYGQLGLDGWHALGAFTLVRTR